MRRVTAWGVMRQGRGDEKKNPTWKTFRNARPNDEIAI